MADIQKVVDDYIATWNETDPERRRALIAETWTEDATYLDPLMSGDGLDGIDAMIAGAQAAYPGHRFELSSGPDLHHDRVRFAWQLSVKRRRPSGRGSRLRHRRRGWAARGGYGVSRACRLKAEKRKAESGQRALSGRPLSRSRLADVPSSDEILSAESEFFASLVAGDVERLEEIVGDDFTIVDVMSGTPAPRDAFLAVVGSGELEFDRLEPAPDEALVRFYGDTAVSIGRT